MGNRHSKSKAVCPVIDSSGPDIQPIVGRLTFHSLAMIVAGAAALFAGLAAIILILRHATHFSNPPEQTQVIRLIFVIPVFTLVSFLCVWLDGKPQDYFIPALDVGDAFPLAAFFLLISAYIVPDEQGRDAFFKELELIDKRETPEDKEVSHGIGLQKLAMMATQWIPVSIILWIATVGTLATGTYCKNSNSAHFAHIWITVFRMFSTTIAIIANLRLYGRAKSVLKPRGAVKQLLYFKLLIFLNFFQMFVFNFLTSRSDLHATKYLTFNGLTQGLPSFILCCELALMAPFFWVLFSPFPYIIRQTSEQTNGEPQRYYGGALGIKAMISAINVADIFRQMMAGVNAKA